jgi:hypothetical protein
MRRVRCVLNSARSCFAVKVRRSCSKARTRSFLSAACCSRLRVRAGIGSLVWAGAVCRGRARRHNPARPNPPPCLLERCSSHPARRRYLSLSIARRLMQGPRSGLRARRGTSRAEALYGASTVLSRLGDGFAMFRVGFTSTSGRLRFRERLLDRLLVERASPIGFPVHLLSRTAKLPPFGVLSLLRW